METTASAVATRDARRWCIAVVAAIAALLAAIAALDAWVDPFQQFAVASRFAPRFYTLHHRYIDPGLAKNAAYDTLLTGSSIMENSRNADIARACGGRAVNLAMPAQSAFEQRLILETALASRKVRQAIVVLDFNAFAGVPDARQDIAGPLPRYLYGRNPLDKLPYLLSGDVLLKSLRILADDRSESFATDPDAPWYWAGRKRFGRDEVLQGLDLGHLNARYAQPARTLAEMQASFAANLLPILRAHPDTRFDLVWPPYSILVWLDFAQRDQLDVSLAFKRYVYETAGALPNVRVVDLQPLREITHDLDRYTDLYHFAPDVNVRVTDAACRGEYQVTAETLNAFEQALRAQTAEVATPAGLARLIAAHPAAK